MYSDRKSILVTGANGYLALHVIKEALSKGYDVRGTVRSQKAADKVRATFPADYGARLATTFVEDLTKPDNFRDAFDNNTVGVIHVASPVHGHVEDNVRDMLDPAIKGAVGIMKASKLYAGPSFQRVVHTSSFAAMLDVSKDPRVGYVYDESDWNPTTFEEAATIQDHVALYVASKALSEKAVWDWVKDNKPDFDIACLNPATVFGPHLEPLKNLDEVTSTSKLLWNLVDAKEIPKLLWAGAIDVRDTAAMLVAALKTPAAGGQRFLLAHHFDWQTAADVAREQLSEEIAERIPVGIPGTGKAWALDSLYQVNGRKAVDVLGIEYRPVSETVKDTLEQFFEVERSTRS
ncbi:nad dependent epimerase [Colletotrichum karsti]|uniref:Nad dependent epimerase n=1 Tax=Colletotrichum karsti TaxID=1095194 RepID=A0A9P6LCZ4_9PEZI|nr:nad dependent epimerase [Colletotrichum karsti]KAF9870239.1 nad dependent epimerase [Colletotrichum karsti]